VIDTCAVWYDRVSLFNDTPAREGPAVLLAFYPHFAVSTCAAAACAQETPYAERPDTPPLIQASERLMAMAVALLELSRALVACGKAHAVARTRASVTDAAPLTLAT
jgi:hypothetical protein